jgi:hypothetical protein
MIGIPSPAADPHQLVAFSKRFDLDPHFGVQERKASQCRFQILFENVGGAGSCRFKFYGSAVNRSLRRF